MPDDRTLVVLTPEQYGRLVASRERLRELALTVEADQQERHEAGLPTSGTVGIALAHCRQAGDLDPLEAAS